ncbi:hypothetical protein TYRP_005374 [Tyrophagus putrescentiae]|nr:hypothetical protein TYRP_005374 [Tyrophagus putrescentiae]
MGGVQVDIDDHLLHGEGPPVDDGTANGAKDGPLVGEGELLLRSAALRHEVLQLAAEGAPPRVEHLLQRQSGLPIGATQVVQPPEERRPKLVHQKAPQPRLLFPPPLPWPPWLGVEERPQQGEHIEGGGAQEKVAGQEAADVGGVDGPLPGDLQEGGHHSGQVWIHLVVGADEEAESSVKVLPKGDGHLRPDARVDTVVTQLLIEKLVEVAEELLGHLHALPFLLINTITTFITTIITSFITSFITTFITLFFTLIILILILLISITSAAAHHQEEDGEKGGRRAGLLIIGLLLLFLILLLLFTFGNCQRMFEFVLQSLEVIEEEVCRPVKDFFLLLLIMMAVVMVAHHQQLMLQGAVEALASVGPQRVVQHVQDVGYPRLKAGHSALVWFVCR